MSKHYCICGQSFRKSYNFSNHLKSCNQDFYFFKIMGEYSNKLKTIHSKLLIKYGSFNNELIEQKMVVKYLKGNEKVLEIGSNIGRNSLVISSILNNSSNLVTLECDKDIAKQLEENKKLNKKNFHIEKSALSKRKLIQKNWDTIESDVLLEGYKWVDTITLENLIKKYDINFDTLILDCEGAFYYILKDMPEIINNINLIIVENDYKSLEHKEYVDSILIENKFKKDYVESVNIASFPCYQNFYEVWTRI